MVYILDNPPWDNASTGSDSPEAIAFVRLQYPVQTLSFLFRRQTMHRLYKLWRDDKGQDIAEYAVMLAVILVIVVGTIRLIGSNSNTVFSNVASSIQ